MSIDDAAAAAGGSTGSISTDPLGTERLAGLAAAVAEVTALPLAEHAEVYQRVHLELQGALADLDSF